MKIFTVDDTFQIEKELAATVGFFDGVHRGHLYLIKQLKKQATKSGLPVAVVTFSGHPRKTIDPAYLQPHLNTFDEKIRALEQAGIDYCYVLDFTQELSELTAEHFLTEVLCARLGIRELLIGYDHKFGKGRLGDFNDYVRYGESCGMRVFPAEEYVGDGLHISSTVIRRKLQEGDVHIAGEMLTRPYSIAGEVINGDRLGRAIGFPTANLHVTDKEKLIPGAGVYAVHVGLGAKTYDGMAYIGSRPTVSAEGERRIEVHLFDFTGEIYGQQVRLYFVDQLRPDIRFESLEALQQQLQLDRENALNRLRQ